MNRAEDIHKEKSEIRISKSETNTNDQNQNDQNRLRFCRFGIMISNFVSNFVLRAPDLGWERWITNK